MSSESETARLVRLFEAAEREVEREMLDAARRGAGYTLAQREAKRAEIHQILAGLRILAEQGRGQDAAGPAWTLVMEAYAEGANGSGAPPISFTQADQRAAEVVYANMAGVLDDGIQMMGRRVDDAFRRVTLAETLSGALGGRGRREVSAGIEEGLERLGIRAFTDAAGREWKLSRYAEMAARTAKVEASSYGALRRVAEAGIDLVEIINSTACPICAPFVQTYSISGQTEGYPQLDAIPPFHPACQCTLVGSTRGLI